MPTAKEAQRACMTLIDWCQENEDTYEEFEDSLYSMLDELNRQIETK